MITGNLNHELENLRNEQTDMEPYRRNIAYYLLSIILGDAEDELSSAIRERLLEKMHWEDAVCFLRLKADVEEKKQIDERLDSFIESASEGKLSTLNRYYLPVIIKLKVASIADGVKLTEYLTETLSQKGCSFYEFTYYLVFDGEISKSNLEQIAEIFKEKEKSVRIGIFGKSVEEGYAHVIRAIAMDIFLQLYEEERPYQVFTLGYWKYDIVKQNLAVCLEELLKKQEEHREDEVSSSKLKRDIEKILYPDKEKDIQEWERLFLAMPFRNSQFEKEKTITYRSLLKSMYGTETAFSDFLERNFAIDNIEQAAMKILEAQECSLYDVEHDMESVCEVVEWEYEKEAKERSVLPLECMVTLDRGFLGLGRQIRLEPCIHRLQEDVWEREAEAFVAEQKRQVTEKLKQYLQTEIFRKRISEKRAEYAELKRQIKLIYREVCVSVNDQNIEVSTTAESAPKMKWNENILDPLYLKKIKETMLPEIRDFVRKEMAEQREQLVWKFQQKLETLRYQDRRNVYYAAKLPGEWEVTSQRKIFAARRENKMHTDNMVQEVWWEQDGCFELVDYRKIVL